MWWPQVLCVCVVVTGVHPHGHKCTSVHLVATGLNMLAGLTCALIYLLAAIKYLPAAWPVQHQSAVGLKIVS